MVAIMEVLMHIWISSDARDWMDFCPRPSFQFTVPAGVGQMQASHTHGFRRAYGWHPCAVAMLLRNVAGGNLPQNPQCAVVAHPVLPTRTLGLIDITGSLDANARHGQVSRSGWCQCRTTVFDSRRNDHAFCNPGGGREGIMVVTLLWAGQAD